MEKSRGGVSAGALKALAVLAMTLDHLAWAFVPRLSLLGMAMHLVGRITAPVMCFFLAEGFAHTRSVKKYVLRLGAFALASQVPYALFCSGDPFYGFLNMMYTLFLCLLALWAWESGLPKPLRLLAVFLLTAATMAGDWAVYAMLFTFAFYLHRGDAQAQARALSAAAGVLALMTAAGYAGSIPPGDVLRAALPELGVLLSLPLLARYRGERGRGGAAAKWFFYFYYPAHLLVIWFLKAGSLGAGEAYALL